MAKAAVALRGSQFLAQSEGIKQQEFRHQPQLDFPAVTNADFAPVNGLLVLPFPPPDRASFHCAKPALVTDGIR